jgi:hypothetical protein
MADDVVFLIDIFYDLIGGSARYRKSGQAVKQVVCGKRVATIRKRYPNAGQLKLALENLEWS